MCINATALITVMLDCSEVNTEISDAGMKTVESNNCREILEDNGNTNSTLATMQEGTRFFYKDQWNFINPFT